jgi:hypothetical protein
MGKKEKQQLISYLRKSQGFDGYKHRQHHKSKKLISPRKLKVEQIKEQELLAEIKDYA